MQSKNKKSIVNARRGIVTAVGYFLQAFLLILIAFQGKYYPFIRDVFGEETANTFLAIKKSIFDFTGNMFWQIICSVLFGVSTFNYMRMGSYCFRESVSIVYVEKVEIKERLIPYEKEIALSERKNAVCDVFEIVPSFLN